MSKATHRGNCQWCNAHQMLPGGVLAKHGYTTEYGFFNGVCPGSGHQPIQLSCDQVELSADRVQARADSLRAQAAAPKADTFAHVYIAAKFCSRHQKSGYRWQAVTIEADAPTASGYVQFFLRYDANGTSVRNRIDHVPYDVARTVEGVKGFLDGRYSQHLLKLAAQADEYVAQQRAIIAAWTPRPDDLKPVKR